MSFGQPFSLNLFAPPNPAQLLIPGSKPPTTSTTETPSSSGQLLGLPPGISTAGEMSAETLRFLSAAGHPGFGPPGPIMGLPPPPRFGEPGPASFPSLEQYRGLLPPGIPPIGLYPGFGGSSELKPGENFGAPPGYFYDPGLVGYPYGGGPLDLNGARRKNATRETTAALKAWLYEHRKNPYPTKGEKIMLAIITKMTLTQVSTWFANARRRLKKENKMTWSPRNRPGEDDDIGADRSNSSLSNPSPDILTLLKDGEDGDVALERPGTETPPAEANNNHNEKSETEPSTLPASTESVNSSSERLGVKREPPSDDIPQPPPPKKPKIWSIADTMASTSSPVTPTTSSISSAASPIRKPEASGPYHFTFNPWQQQQQQQQQMSQGVLGGLMRPPMSLAPGFSPGGFFPSPHPSLAQFRPDLFGGGRLGGFVGFGSGVMLSPGLSGAGGSSVGSGGPEKAAPSGVSPVSSAGAGSPK